MPKDPLQLLLEHLRTEEGTPILTSSLWSARQNRACRSIELKTEVRFGRTAGTSAAVSGR